MNQILTTKKIYVTPELKRKRKFYKFDFFLSVFLVCLLFSFYIYAEYDREKYEAMSQEILETVSTNVEEMLVRREVGQADDTTASAKDNVILFVLDDLESEESSLGDVLGQLNDVGRNAESIQYDIRYSEGEEYWPIATIKIPKIGIEYPILSRTSDVLLKMSPTKFWGSEPNEIGNFCIVGHNYRNSKFFSKVPTLENGDLIEIQDLVGRTIAYEVYDKYTVDPEDLSCTSQHTNGKKEVTLITCTNDSKLRVIVKLVEVK